MRSEPIAFETNFKFENELQLVRNEQWNHTMFNECGVSSTCTDLRWMCRVVQSGQPITVVSCFYWAGLIVCCHQIPQKFNHNIIAKFVTFILLFYFLSYTIVWRKYCDRKSQIIN